jgi:hypothetical protein
MRKYLIIFSLLVSFSSFSRGLNDWIEYDQNYYRLPILNDGVYRITYTQLINAGINVLTIDPRNFQIFAKGEEQYIYVRGESDGSFESGDYIEFYAEGNDGELDQFLFSDPEHQGNPYISMFSDTIHYFLTWNDEINNRRMSVETDVNFSGYTPLSYFMDEKITIGDKFSRGYLTIYGWPVPEYSSSEGYLTSDIDYKESQTFTLETAFPSVTGPSPTLFTRVFGKNRMSHSVDYKIGGVTLIDTTFNLFFGYNGAVSFNRSLLGNPTNVVVTNNDKSEAPNERLALSHVGVRYARQFNLGGANEYMMEIPGSTSAKDYVSISNFNNANSTVRIYNLDFHQRIVVQPVNGKYDALIPNTSNASKRCLITSDANILTVSRIEPVGATSARFTNYQEISDNIGGADYFIVSSEKLLDGADAYANYRNSTGFNALVVNIEELYDQYAWGIRKHPISIRYLMEEVIDIWNTDAKDLFLLGKSVDASVAKGKSVFELNMVPTWGVLGADVGFTAGLTNNTILEPEIPTGRLSALNNQEVYDYLEKVQEYETAEPAEWMKNVLHFGGGASASEQTVFKSYLANYQRIIEDTLAGCSVHGFFKNSSDPLQVNLSDSVRNLVNQGSLLMTFFGHAYGTNFDQSIDEPENYDNDGRYPFLIANSCLIGNIHTTNTESGSERFVKIPNKGTIGFLGSSSLGVTTFLNRYTSNFYLHYTYKNYGASIGELVKYTIKDTQDENNELNRDVCLHMTLHADPAIKLYAFEKPDYTLYGENSTAPRIYTEPAQITADIDSFDLKVVMTNIGKATVDSFNVRITREFPSVNKSDSVIDILVSRLTYKDTLSIKFPVDLLNGVGVNKFSASLDALSIVDELNEMNNDGEINVIINSAAISPVYPFEYSIIDDHKPVLKASTGNPYAISQTYIFEIDTNEQFTSPIKVSRQIVSEGGVIEWSPAEDSQLNSFFDEFNSSNAIQTPNVFYWRVGLQSDVMKWENSSFQYVQNRTGWGQSHWQQFDENAFQFIDYDYTQRKFEFREQIKQLEVTTHKSGHLPYREDIKYRIDGAIQCFTSSRWANMVFAVVIDKRTLEPWHTLEHGDYGHLNYDQVIQGWNEYNFYFNMGSSSHVDSLVSFIEDVPDSNYFFIYNFRQHRLNYWYNSGTPSGDALKDAMANLGSDVDSMMNYNNSWPYIFFAQKGNPNSAVDVFDEDGEDFSELFRDLKNNWFNGSMRSIYAGPAKSWDALFWEYGNSDAGTADTARIELYGISQSGNRELLYDSLMSVGERLNLSDLGANNYTYLQVNSFFADDSIRTPSVPKRIQITHDEIPEIALNPLRIDRTQIIDSVAEGDQVRLLLAIENISSVTMPSFQSVYWLIDRNFTNSEKQFKVFDALAPGEIAYDTVVVSTEGLTGNNNIWYEVNPQGYPNEYQLEQYHFNNIYLHEFKIGKDSKNPILDVAFDGVRILDGDIVSPSPEIVISLKDENNFLALNDPDLMEVYITYVLDNGADSTILILPSEYEFIPGTTDDNEAQIIFSREFTKDGYYYLGVRARDRSNNKSGTGNGVYDYSIKFQVISESSITQMINYPNPFSTSTRFVFTLTGSEIPDEIRIQIMTISGKVVKEIDQVELGPINIGRNISEYAWDGRDEFGDQLANGVYLYRVIVLNNGREVNRRTVAINNGQINGTLSNELFNNGYGKMYLLR